MRYYAYSILMKMEKMNFKIKNQIKANVMAL